LWFRKTIIDLRPSEETSMDVGVWLRSLGLGQYEATFRDNEIDGAVLPRLTVDDLKDLGVAVVGHRRKIMSAIEELNAASVARTDAVEGLPTQAALPVSASDGAERRPITVMFCDLVGSTSLAAKLDAEDWRNLVNAYLDEASKAVTGFGGHVLKKLGDGLMALFGYPQAQENDAERAVRAALAIQRALSDLNARHVAKGAPELSARIGLESGPVVVEATGEVFGDAPNLAARVQAEAELGSVLITLNVQRQVAGLFVAEEQSTRELKGVSQPVQLFRIVRASGGGRRGGARTLTPLVGREEELGVLTRRWERARAGEGQLLLIVGEPGLGKSRLIEEFHARLAETPHTWVEWSASQLLQNTPLHPIAEWGRLRFGSDAAAEQRFADLESTLRSIGLDPVEHAPLLAPLVDILPPPGRAANFPPEELRRRQLAAMTAWVLAGARSQPVVLAFEDLHWADPTSLDLLRAFAERGAQAPLLLVATTRPEFHAPWSLRSHHSLISLSPLDRAGVAHMVGEITARHAFSKELIEGVNERTGGVPLFVEEVTRLLVERGEQGGVQAIPPTLQQSLAARLDRLGPAREVAQIGAVLGRDFAYALLRDVAEIDEPALHASLDRLADADLLFVEGAPPQANYRFKHALIQDAAYQSLLKSRRQALHRRAAELLRDDPERAAAEPEVIGRHFTQGAVDDLAIEWWGKAGDQALRRSAFQEAIAHLSKAIEMADKGPVGSAATTTVAEQSRRLKLQTNYAQAVLWSKGFAADETRAAFERTGDLATRAELPAEGLPALFGQFLWNLLHGDIRSARQIAERFLQEAEAQGRLAEAGVGHRLVGLTSMFLGDLVEARRHLELALSTYDRERDSEARERFALDTGVAARVYLALASWLGGDLDCASQLIEEAMGLGGDLGHLPDVIHTLWYKVYIRCLRNDAESVAVDAEKLLRTSQQHGVELFVMLADVALSWARGRLGDARSGPNELRRSLAEYTSKGNRLFVPSVLALLAELESAAGDAERALALIEEGLATAQDGGQHYTDSFLHRLRGDILLDRDPDDIEPAEEAYRTAIEVAKAQEARSYQLLGSLSLAKLYQSTARPTEAHAVLVPALDGFAPTLEMPEIAEGQALLATLAESEEVKAVVVARRQRLHLQISYGQAVTWLRGYAAEETKTAFARAQELAAGIGNAAERFDVYYSQWAGCMVRGEPESARAMAESFRQDAKNEGTLPDLAAACCTAGRACLSLGDLSQARAYVEEALRICDPEWDGETRHRHGTDCESSATAYLAHVVWQFGEVEPARQLIDHAISLAVKLGHIPTLVNVYAFKTTLEMFRADAQRTLRDAETLVEIAGRNGVAWFLNFGTLCRGWARARLSDRDAGMAEMREALGKYADEGFWGFFPHFLGRLAELEAEGEEAEAALAHVDEAVTLARRTGERWTDALLHRIHGDILLKADSGLLVRAEDAYRAAISIARDRGARGFGLQAALRLAKLYRSTGRSAEAHAVLAPALQGFAPTLELPEIGEALELMATIEANAQ
jgi:class 3 adenylate cyclase/predicted ATPase